MKLLERFGVPPPAAPTQPVVLPIDLAPRYGKNPVGASADLSRICGLPRRDLAASYTQQDFDALERRLRLNAPKCVCAEQGRECPTHLRSVQALALLEAERCGGLAAPIGVGFGKTLIDLLLPIVMGSKVAVLLIPPNLKTQLFERDLPYYGGHWMMPNIVGGQWFVTGRPALHVLTYNKLSQPDSSDLLKRIKPDLVIGDEIHHCKNPDGPRMRRIFRFDEESAEVRYALLSGTFASRSVKDCSHLFALVLGDRSPLPLHKPTVEEWATALDPFMQGREGNTAAPPGALERLCNPGEHVRDGYRRRRNDTLGVVATAESAIKQTLIIRKREPGPVPVEILRHIDGAHGGMRPDGEEFVEQLQMMACARQLGAGFFHRWRYPRGEPPELIERWFLHRQSFNRELRDKLKRPREFLDSPGLCIKAAIRAYQDPPYKGDKPTWKAGNWPDWYSIHDEVRPVPEAVWLSDFLIRDAAAWAKKTTGIVWVDFPELGEKIARAAGVPWYGGGEEASTMIAREKGDRSIIASIKAHGTGKNLQMFSRNYIATPPADGATWEQLIGRTHRPGQLADEVEVEIAQHTEDYRNAFAKAREYARFIQQTDGQPQKLLLANYEWPV